MIVYEGILHQKIKHETCARQFKYILLNYLHFLKTFSKNYLFKKLKVDLICGRKLFIILGSY